MDLGDGNSLVWLRLPEGDWLLISAAVAGLLAGVRSPASSLPAPPLCRVWGCLRCLVASLRPTPPGLGSGSPRGSKTVPTP